MYVYGTCWGFNVYCNDCEGLCGNVCCVVTMVKYSVFSLGLLEVCCMLYVCVRDVMLCFQFVL